jgi:hypothetical protein
MFSMCLWFVVIGILFTLSEKLKLYPTSVLENNIISVLSGLKDINHFVDQIVTGLPIFTKIDKLYSETGWATLSSRRHNRKLQLFYNIKNGHAPNYLRELMHLVAIFQVWLNNTLHNYPIFHRHIQQLGGYIPSTVFLDFVYLI